MNDGSILIPTFVLCPSGAVKGLIDLLKSGLEDINSKLDTLQNNFTNRIEVIQSTLGISHGEQSIYTCGGEGGWRRIAHLNMTKPGSNCPPGWNMTGYSKSTCGRASGELYTCDSVTFRAAREGEYNRVCGRIKAYQYGSTDAFEIYNNGLITTIEGAYVAGVSVTHGCRGARQHIWTFAAGLSEGNPNWGASCPCDANHPINVPNFVGGDYFCESGVNGRWSWGTFRDDPLWDGKNCLPSSKCCSQNNPPYFVKNLPVSSTDDIEVRICLWEKSNVENIAVELLELYVK